MRKRDAMREAHEQAAAVIRQYVDQQGGGVADTEAEHEAVAAALYELADRHDRAALATRPSTSAPAAGDSPVQKAGNAGFVPQCPYVDDSPYIDAEPGETLVCTLRDGHDGDHRLAVHTEG